MFYLPSNPIVVLYHDDFWTHAWQLNKQQKTVIQVGLSRTVEPHPIRWSPCSLVDSAGIVVPPWHGSFPIFDLKSATFIFTLRDGCQSNTDSRLHTIEFVVYWVILLFRWRIYVVGNLTLFQFWKGCCWKNSYTLLPNNFVSWTVKL